jgi:hypothetical protein
LVPEEGHDEEYDGVMAEISKLEEQLNAELAVRAKKLKLVLPFSFSFR